MIRRPPRSTQSRSSAASDVYKRQRERNDDVQGLGGEVAGMHARQSCRCNHSPRCDFLDYSDHRGNHKIQNYAHAITDPANTEISYIYDKRHRSQHLPDFRQSHTRKPSHRNRSSFIVPIKPLPPFQSRALNNDQRVFSCRLSNTKRIRSNPIHDSVR